MGGQWYITPFYWSASRFFVLFVSRKEHFSICRLYGARSGRTDAVVARSGGAAAAPPGCYLTAMVSISTSAPMGSAATSKATRAGGFSV